MRKLVLFAWIVLAVFAAPLTVKAANANAQGTITYFAGEANVG